MKAKKNLPSYFEWRKKNKKKHSPSTVYKFITKYFKMKGIDIKIVSCGPHVFEDLYWHLVDHETRLSRLENAN